MKGVKNSPVIDFGEYETNVTSNMYVFMDCLVDYAYKCHTNHFPFSQYVPFGKKCKHSLLSLRTHKAVAFCRQCRGIFTMGQWLADDLINCVGVDST